MAELRNQRVRQRAGATLVLAAMTGGLLAVALAGSPAARADDPYTDLVTAAENEISAADADFTFAGTAFSTAGETNEGLIATVTGFDNLFVSPVDSTLVDLTGAATNTNVSSYDIWFIEEAPIIETTAAGQTAVASADLSAAEGYFSSAVTDFSSGEYTDGVLFLTTAGYNDLLASQAELLAGLFSLGV